MSLTIRPEVWRYGDVPAAGVTPTAEPVIRGRDLVVRRSGHTILDCLTFGIVRGQVTGLLGPSGCGKTTLLRTLVGVQRIAAGEVWLLGLPAGHPELRARVGYATRIRPSTRTSR